MNEGIASAYQGQCQFVGFLPRAAVYQYLGIFQAQQFLGPFGGGLGHHHGHRHPQFAPGVGHRQAGIAPRGRHQVPGTPRVVNLAGVAHPAQLERATRLQGVKLEPDVAPGSQRQRA